MLRSVSALCASWSRRSWWTMTRLLSDIRFQLQPNQLTAVDRPRAPEVANRQATQVTFCVRGVISPLLSNIYLNEVDKMLERAKEATRYGKYTGIEYARFADDLVILIDAYPRHDWLLPVVEKRLREELAALQVEINEEKSRIVDL